MKRQFLFHQMGRFFLISSLKRCNKLTKYPPLIDFPFKRQSMIIIPRTFQKTDAMNLSSDGTVYAFFGADSSLSVHCFDCSLASGVKWSQNSWTQTPKTQSPWVLTVTHFLGSYCEPESCTKISHR